jgi:hypothetical protein
MVRKKLKAVGRAQAFPAVIFYSKQTHHVTANILYVAPAFLLIFTHYYRLGSNSSFRARDCECQHCLLWLLALA